jgi:hypothetical protein
LAFHASIGPLVPSAATMAVACRGRKRHDKLGKPFTPGVNGPSLRGLVLPVPSDVFSSSSLHPTFMAFNACSYEGRPAWSRAAQNVLAGSFQLSARASRYELLYAIVWLASGAQAAHSPSMPGLRRRTYQSKAERRNSRGLAIRAAESPTIFVPIAEQRSITTSIAGPVRSLSQWALSPTFHSHRPPCQYITTAGAMRGLRSVPSP